MKILKILSSAIVLRRGSGGARRKRQGQDHSRCRSPLQPVPGRPNAVQWDLGRSRHTQPILVFFMRGHLQVCRRQRRRLDFLGDLRPSSRSLRSGANRQFNRLQRPSDHRGHNDAGTYRRARHQRDNLTGCLNHGPRWSDVHAGRRLGVRHGQAPRPCLRLSHGREHNVEVSNATGVLRPVADSRCRAAATGTILRLPTPRPARTLAIRSRSCFHPLPATRRQPHISPMCGLTDSLSALEPDRPRRSPRLGR